MKLNTNPTSKHLAEIKSWLVEEKKNFNEGFYCNCGKNGQIDHQDSE